MPFMYYVIKMGEELGGGGKCLWFMTWEEVQKPPIIDYIINKCFFEKV